MFKQKYVAGRKAPLHRTYTGRKLNHGRCTNCRIMAAKIRYLPVSVRAKILGYYVRGLKKRSTLRKSNQMAMKPKFKKFGNFYRK